MISTGLGAIRELLWVQVARRCCGSSWSPQPTRSVLRGFLAGLAMSAFEQALAYPLLKGRIGVAIERPYREDGAGVSGTSTDQHRPRTLVEKWDDPPQFGDEISILAVDPIDVACRALAADDPHIGFP